MAPVPLMCHEHPDVESVITLPTGSGRCRACVLAQYEEWSGTVRVWARPQTLTWFWGPATEMTMSILDPSDRAPKPHQHLDAWERTVLAAALRKILTEVEAVTGDG